jgi:hypothetical protein
MRVSTAEVRARRPPPRPSENETAALPAELELTQALYALREEHLEEWVDGLEEVLRAADTPYQEQALKDAEDLRRRLDLNDLRTRLGEAMASDGSTGIFGENVASLIAALERAERYWPKVAPIDPDRVDRALDALDEAFIEIGYVTVPDRLAGKLDSQSVGGSFDFYVEFADEFTNDEQIDAIVNWLAAHPRSDDGALIDPESGVVYRLPQGPARKWRLATTAWMAVVGVLVMFGAWALGRWLFDIPDPDWPYSDLRSLLGLYLAVLLGAAIHFLAAAGSKISFDDELAVTVPRRSRDWLSIRWVSVAWLFFPAFVTTLGLGTTDLRPDDFETFSTILLAGYSADSLSTNFLSRLGKAAEKTSKAVGAKQLPGDDPGKQPGRRGTGEHAGTGKHRPNRQAGRR